MKKVLKLSVFFLIFSLFGFRQGEAQVYTDPIDYNDALIDEIVIVNNYVVLLDSLAAEDDFNYKKYEKARKKTLRQIKKSTKKIKKIGDLDGDSMLKEAAISYMNRTNDVVANEWKEIGQKMKNVENLSQDEINELIDVIDKAYKKYDEKLIELDSIQNKFADKHGYVLE